ncbi:MAG: restriction endonuclease subunit S [Treponema sp.]|nr:restriction endonuclease subunit S [Treponema sp.]
METKEYRLKQVTEKITKGTTPSNIGESFTEEGIMYFRSELIGKSKYIDKSDGLLFISNETHEKLKRSQIQKNDLLFSMAGIYLGKISLVGDEDFPANTNQAVAIIRFNSKEIDLEYVYYYMTQRWYNIYINSLTAQAAQPNINLEQIGNLKLNLPPLPTQQKIASILSAYDNLIQNYKKQIEALQTAANELYKEWFVRFRFTGWQNAKFENGIPEGWKVERLGNLAEIKSGKRLPQGYDFSDYPTRHPYIRARDIKHGNIDSNDFAYISDEVYQKLKRYIVDENDILLTIVANIGDVGYVNKSLQGFNLTENAVRLTNYSKRIEPRYLCYYLSQPATKIYMEGLAVGAAQAKLGIYKIETIKVLLPNINIQKDFSRRITLIHTKIDNLNKQITNLTQQRDLLLPRLMSGKLELK